MATSNARPSGTLWADKPIDDITPADAEGFRAALLARGLSPTTVATRLAFARQFFQYAVKARLLAENPFAGVKYPKRDVKARQRYISPEMTQRLIEAAPAWLGVPWWPCADTVVTLPIGSLVAQVGARQLGTR